MICSIGCASEIDSPSALALMSDWESKRKEVLKRDNYTCQRCGQFNPELGMVEVVVDDGENVEHHRFEGCPKPYDNNYILSQSRTGLAFNFTFGHCWPVFPVMQVHHRKYIHGREAWDYSDEDLVTLCKRCHAKLHVTEKIPVYNQAGLLIEERLYVPHDHGSGRHHDCPEWTFIKRTSEGEYVLSEIDAEVQMWLLPHEDQNWALEEASKALGDFLRRYFPTYSK